MRKILYISEILDFFLSLDLMYIVGIIVIGVVFSWILFKMMGTCIEI